MLKKHIFSFLTYLTLIWCLNSYLQSRINGFGFFHVSWPVIGMRLAAALLFHLMRPFYGAKFR